MMLTFTTLLHVVLRDIEHPLALDNDKDRRNTDMGRGHDRIMVHLSCAAFC